MNTHAMLNESGDLAPVLTPAEEKRIAKQLSPGVAWPTLALAVALPAVQWSTVGLGIARLLPIWACVPVIAWASFAHYTLVHEAVHGNLTPGHSKLRWLNPVVGWIGAIGLTFPWPLMNRSHLLHHTHTNTDQDPDIVVKGSLGQLLVKWLVNDWVLSLIPLIVFKYLAPADYRKVTAPLTGSEATQISAFQVAVLGVLALFCATGHALDWFWLIYAPPRLGSLWLTIFFQWLPHHPLDRTERYRNTRISLWPGAGALTMQQNLHLMHHLWPSVPFYNYGRLYRRLRPTLVAKGSRIEGLMVGRYTQDKAGIGAGSPPRPAGSR